jgi:hypothetical protein
MPSEESLLLAQASLFSPFNGIGVKIGEEPGFFALLSAPSLEEAKARVAHTLASVEEFEVDIYPVNHFPQFD